MDKEPTESSSESLAREANSLWGVGRTLLDGPSDYDPVKLGYLLDAIRNCVERSKQAGHQEWADSLEEVATELARRVRLKDAPPATH